MAFFSFLFWAYRFQPILQRLCGRILFHLTSKSFIECLCVLRVRGIHQVFVSLSLVHSVSGLKDFFQGIFGFVAADKLSFVANFLFYYLSMFLFHN